MIRAAVGLGRPAEEAPPAREGSQRRRCRAAVYAAAVVFACASVAASHARAQQAPAVTVSVAAVGPVVEGQNLEFRVSLSTAASQQITVAYTLGGTANSSDYTDTTGGSVVFMTGDIAKTISLMTVANDGEENDETVQVTLSAPAPPSAVHLGAAASATGTIRDGDVSRFTISSPSVAEGDAGSAILEFTVELVPASSLATTVTYSVTGGTAEEGVDYAPLPSRTLGFQAGRTSVAFSVEVVGDSVVEADETVVISLTNPTSGTIVHRLQGVGTGTIVNDDFGFSIDSPSVVESQGGTVPLVFTVTLGSQFSGQTSVDYSVSGGTATVDEDYLPLPNGSLTFVSCQLQGGCEQTITVAVIGDLLAEEDETIEVTLFNARGGVDIEQGAETGVGTIYSESATDATVSVERANLIRGSEADEGATVEFEVRLSGTLNYDLHVQYQVRPDAAGINPLQSGTATVAARTTEEQVSISLGTLHALSSLGNLYIDVMGVSSRGVAPNSGLPEVSGALGSDGMVVAAVILNVATERREMAGGRVLAGYGRSLGTSIVGMVWDRVSYSAVDAGNSRMRLGGRNLDADAFAASGDASQAAKEIARALGIEIAAAGDYAEDGFRAVEGDAAAYRKWAGLPEGDGILSGTDLAVTIRRGEYRNFNRGGLFTIWGKGDVSEFENESQSSSSPSTKGGLTAGHLGMDYRFRENLLVGIALSQSRSDTDYSFAGGTASDGSSKVSFETVTPYIHINSPGGPGVWGSVSAGSGTMELDDNAGTVESDVSLQAIAGGFHSGHAGTGTMELAVKADAYTARITSEEGTGDGSLGKLELEVSRIRFALESASDRTIGDGSAIRSRIELGARYDIGNDQEGGGADVGGEFGFISSDSGLEVKGRGNMLLVHEQKGVSEWGVGLGVGYSSQLSGRGVSLTLEPTWNAPRRVDADALWKRTSFAGSEANDQGAAIRARLGYGLGALYERALATVYGEMRNGEESRWLRLGTELRESRAVIGVFRFDLYGEREELRSSDPDNSVMLEGSLRF